MDGDDYVEPTMFERLVDAAAGCDADLAMCEYQEVVDGSGERRDPADAHRWAELTVAVLCAGRPRPGRQFLRFIAVPWRKLYRRSLLEDNAIRFPVSDGFYEDNPFHWFTVLSARSIAVVPEVLCYHRVGRAGQTMATADERLFQIFAAPRHDPRLAGRPAAARRLRHHPARLGGLAAGVDRPADAAAAAPDAVRHPGADLRRVLRRTTLRSALREGNKGATAQRLSAAVSKGEFGSFVRALAGRPGSNSNPVLSAAFHLRHSGVAAHGGADRTLPAERAAWRPGRQDVSRVARGRRESRRQDVLFGLMVIQQRLRGLETRLGELQHRLQELERRIG